MKIKCKNNIIIAGHRGSPATCPENTMLSFKTAIEGGADMIETDIRLTKDGELVLMHDDSAARTAGVDKKILDMNLSEVKELYVGDPALGCRVPLLKELLDLTVENKELLLNLEFKVSEADLVEKTVDTVTDMCKEYGICDRVIINSFNFRVLKYCKEKHGELFLIHGFYPYSVMGNVPDGVDPTGYLDYACFWGSGEDAKKKCEELIALGIEPCTGSISDPETFDEICSYGCSMFTDNNPCRAVKWRDEDVLS